MVVVSITPLILVAGIIGYRFETSYRNEVIAHLSELVLKHQQNVNVFLGEKLSSIRTLAASYSYDQLVEPGFLHKQLKILQEISGGSLVDLGVLDEKGRQISYAGPYAFANVDYGGASWFKQAIERPFYISDVFLGLRGSPHFIISVRCYSEEKKWLLRGSVDFEIFNKVVENVRLGKTGTAFILNTQGVLQTRSVSSIPINREFILSKVPGINLEENVQSGVDVKAEEGWKFRLRDDTGRLLVVEGPDSQGLPSIYILTPIKSGEWVLVFQQELEDAFSDLFRARRLGAIILILGGFAIMLKAFLLSKRMVYRIAQVDQEKQLMNERMIEAGKLASLGELAAGIAHEINNPVAVMVEEAGWIEDLLQEDDLKQSIHFQELKEAVLQIKTQGKRCRGITQKLLSFARRTDPRPQLVRIQDIVEDVLGIAHERANQANITFKRNLPPDLPQVFLSPSEMQQVLLNLVNNAIDAIDEERGGTIEIAAGVEENCLTIVVKDDGEGIPKERIQRIFDPFYTTKPVGKGTGLGLSICYGIIKKWKGRITVESQVAEGTAFYVSVPVFRKGEVPDCDKTKKTSAGNDAAFAPGEVPGNRGLKE